MEKGKPIDRLLKTTWFSKLLKNRVTPVSPARPQGRANSRLGRYWTWRERAGQNEWCFMIQISQIYQNPSQTSGTSEPGRGSRSFNSTFHSRMNPRVLYAALTCRKPIISAFPPLMEASASNHILNPKI